MDTTSAEYIANLHRGLQAACERASITPDLTKNALPLRPAMPGAEAAAGGRSPRASLGCTMPPQLSRCDGIVRASTTSAALLTRSNSPADEGAGRTSDDDMIKRSCSVSTDTLARAGGMDDVAKEVLRLRLLKQQHDELGSQLTRAKHQIKRVSPQNILQLHSYLERNLCDLRLAANVQEPLIRLLECMCAVTGIEMTTLTPESLLNSCRKLLRDPHSFTSRLIDMEPLSSVEAQGLAPFLLLETEYKQTADKDVNACYEALHGWLSAFYFFSAVSDQVSQVAQDLSRQEAMLRRLGGHTEEPKKRGGGLGRGWPCSRDMQESPEDRPLPDKSAGSPKVPVHNRDARDARSREPSVGGMLTKSKSLAGTSSGRTSPSQRIGSARSGIPTFGNTGNTGVSRRLSGSPADHPATGKASAETALGITRMPSDKALSQVLRANKKEASPAGMQSPKRSSGSGSSSSSSLGALGGCASPTATRSSADRMGRRPPGALPTVPERYSSVPSTPETLLESIHRRSSAPIGKKEPDVPTLRWPANHPARIG